MGATPWSELSATETGWVEGFPDPTYDASLDYFIDVLFEATSLFAVTAVPYTELSIAATPTTELTAPSTPYTELSL